MDALRCVWGLNVVIAMLACLYYMYIFFIRRCVWYLSYSANPQILCNLYQSDEKLGENTAD